MSNNFSPKLGEWARSQMPAERALGLFEISEAARKAGLEIVGPGQGFAGLRAGELALVEWADPAPPTSDPTLWEKIRGRVSTPARRTRRELVFRASDGLKIEWWPKLRGNELVIQPFLRGWSSASFATGELAGLFGVETIVIPTPESVVELPSDAWTEFDYDPGYGLQAIPLQAFKSEVPGIIGPFIERLQALMK